MKVIVAVDGSECSLNAIDFILERPWRDKDEILVLTVMETVPVDFGLGHLPSEEMRYDNELYEECSKIASRAEQKIKSKLKKLKIEHEVPKGFIAEEICKKATQYNADLIIIGSHGRKGVEKFFLGSVAEEVLKSAPCSVEIIRPKVKVCDGETEGEQKAMKECSGTA